MSAQIRAIAGQLRRIVITEVNKAVREGTPVADINREWLTRFLDERLGLRGGVSWGAGRVSWTFNDFGCKTIYVDIGGCDIAIACNWDENPDGINRIEIFQPLTYRTEEKTYFFGMEHIPRAARSGLLEAWNKILANYVLGDTTEDEEELQDV